MQNAALMWLVYDHTADPIWPPLLLVAQVGPTLLLGTWGGALADRLPKRRLIFATQSAFLGTAVLMTLLVAADRVEPWLLLAVQVVNGVVQSVDLPTRLAFVPDLVPRPDLINAVSLNSMLFNSARAVGPALSGLLFLLADAVIQAGWLPGSRPVTLGAVWCFAPELAELRGGADRPAAIDVPGVRRGSAPRSEGMLGGFRYVLTHPRLAGLLLMTGLLCVFGWPVLSLFPAYTRLALGHAEKEYSVLVSSIGAGALVAALTTATFGTVGRRGFFLLAGASVTAAGLLALSVAESLGARRAGGGLSGVRADPVPLDRPVGDAAERDRRDARPGDGPVGDDAERQRPARPPAGRGGGDGVAGAVGAGRDGVPARGWSRPGRSAGRPRVAARRVTPGGPNSPKANPPAVTDRGPPSRSPSPVGRTSRRARTSGTRAGGRVRRRSRPGSPDR